MGEFMIVVGESELAKNIANSLGVDYCEIMSTQFPDGEISICVPEEVKGNEVVLVQSIKENVNSYLIKLFFTAYTARDLGAKKIIAVIPYLVYARQDARFHPGESVSSNIVGRLLKDCVDEVITIEPHLHRNKTEDIFKQIPLNAVSAVQSIGGYLQNRESLLLVAPDKGAQDLVKNLSDFLNCEYLFLKKQRIDNHTVDIKLSEDKEIKHKEIVVLDDIISTGGTMKNTVKLLQEKGAENIICIGIHGLFIGNCVQALSEAGANEIISTNTINSEHSKIDVSGAIAEAVKK